MLISAHHADKCPAHRLPDGVQVCVGIYIVSVVCDLSVTILRLFCWYTISFWTELTCSCSWLFQYQQSCVSSFVGEDVYIRSVDRGVIWICWDRAVTPSRHALVSFSLIDPFPSLVQLGWGWGERGGGIVHSVIHQNSGGTMLPPSLGAVIR